MSQRGASQSPSSASGRRRDHAFTIVECHHGRLDALRERCRAVASDRALLFDCQGLEATRGDLRRIGEVLRRLTRLRVHALYGLSGAVRRGLDAAGYRDLLNSAHPDLDAALQAVRREQSARRAIAEEQKRSERVMFELLEEEEDDEPLWRAEEDEGEVVINFERADEPVLGLGSLLDDESGELLEVEPEPRPSPRVAPIAVGEDEELEAIPAPRPGRRALRRMAAAEPKRARLDIHRLARFVAEHIRDDGDLALLEALHRTGQIGEKALQRTLHTDRAGLDKRLERLVAAAFIEQLESGRFFKTRQFRLAPALPPELSQALAWRRRDHAVFTQWLEGTKKLSRREKSR